MHKKSFLFYSVLAVFVGTAIITFCGLTQVILIDEQYLGLLVKTLIGQVIIAVISLFKGTNFFSDDKASLENLQKENSNLKDKLAKLTVSEDETCSECERKDQKISEVTQELKNTNSLASKINGMFSHGSGLKFEEIREQLPYVRTEDIWSAINQLNEQNKIRGYASKSWIKA